MACAEAALRAGLGVNAGHDLNRANLADFLRAVPGVLEVSIGHALIADALELGLAETVRAYLRCIHLAAAAAGAMIYGIGTDICDVRRVAAVVARRGERFAEKVLGPHEIEVFRSRRGRVEERGLRYLATRFSAKEAFSKAIGLGMRMPMTWRACEIVKAAERQARDPAAWRAGRVVRGTAPASPCQRHRRDRLRRQLRRRRTRGTSMTEHAPVVLDIAGLALTDDDRRRLRHPLTGGLILFARNWRIVSS